MLERYNQFKRSIKQDAYFIKNIRDFLERNLPIYKETIEKVEDFTRKTFDSFREEMLKSFGIKINVSTGDVIQLD